MERFVLVADDNEGIIEIISTYLAKEGFYPIYAINGLEALEKFEKYRPVITLLDVMMPFKDGFQVCREIRRISNLPIIMITAKGEDSDKIMGLDIGADDYIVKPFSPGEVIARIRAILRRVDITEEQSNELIRHPGLQIDISNYEVLIDKEVINLTKREVDILWLLASNPGKVFSRDNLLNSIWGYDYYGDLRTVDTHIKRLRAKLNIKGGLSLGYQNHLGCWV